VLNSGEGAGHGKTVDLAVLDETWADKDDSREQALALLLDEDSSDSAVWREFRFMFRDLREAAGGSDLAQDLEKEFAALDG